MTPIQPKERPRLSSRARQQTDKVTGKPILLYPEGILILNPTGCAIVGLCTGEKTFDEIVADLAARYRVTPEKVTPEVTSFLDRLRVRNLLDVLADAPNPVS